MNAYVRMHIANRDILERQKGIAPKKQFCPGVKSHYFPILIFPTLYFLEKSHYVHFLKTFTYLPKLLSYPRSYMYWECR